MAKSPAPAAEDKTVVTEPPPYPGSTPEQPVPPEPPADPAPMAEAAPTPTPPVESTPETVPAEATPAEGNTPIRTGKPSLGVIAHALGDGTTAIHAIEPDGTEHQIVMPTNHGALLAFTELLKDWFGRLGARAISAKTQPAEPIPAAEPSSPPPPATAA